MTDEQAGGFSELDDLDRAIRDGMGAMPAGLGMSWGSIDDLDEAMLSDFVGDGPGNDDACNGRGDGDAG